MQMTVSRDIAASAATVWATITDIDGSAQVLSGVERLERLDDRATFGVGVRWRETRVKLGGESTEELVVTEVEPPRSYTIRAESADTSYVSVLRVEPLGQHHCRLTKSLAAELSGLLGRLLAATVGRLLLRTSRELLRQDLVDIATHAERAAR